MEDESRDPRAPAGPVDDDGSNLSPTTTAATDHAVAAGEQPVNTGAGAGATGVENEHSNDSTATTTPTAVPTPAHADGDRKASSAAPADVATSPRGSTAGFVAPSSYLRPLAVTREREDHYRGEGRRGEAKVVHPLDREQREGLVSERSSAGHELGGKGSSLLGYMADIVSSER